VGRTTVAAGGDRTQADGAKGDHAAEKGRKSLPYWIPVTTLRGTGEATTDSFTIDATALQWRLRWRCETTPFTVVGVDVKGKASKRKLANALLCPEEAEGFSGDKGRQALKVTTPGAWTLVVEEQVDRPLVEPPTPAMSAATVMGTGEVYGVDRQGEGKATVYRLADGTWKLRLDDFFVTMNSDLELRLSPLAQPRSTDDIARAPFVAVAPLKATVGSMNYDLPADFDPARHRSIVIWCEATRNAYAALSLSSSTSSS
jgi:hypothetical protein